MEKQEPFTERRGEALSDRVGHLEMQGAVLGQLMEQSIADRASLRLLITAVDKRLQENTDALNDWKTTQRGFIAGAVAVIGFVGTVLFTTWDWVQAHFR